MMMAEKDANRPYTLEELIAATKDLAHARATLKDKQNTLQRYRDAVKSFEKDEQEAEADVARHEALVRKIGSHLEKK